RAEWDDDPSWDVVADIHAAAAAVRAWAGDSVLLTTGRRDLAAFACDSGYRLLVRTVDPPDGPVPARMSLTMDRRPYTDGAEPAPSGSARVATRGDQPWGAGGARDDAGLAGADDQQAAHVGLRGVELAEGGHRDLLLVGPDGPPDHDRGGRVPAGQQQVPRVD